MFSLEGGEDFLRTLGGVFDFEYTLLLPCGLPDALVTPFSSIVTDLLVRDF